METFQINSPVDASSAYEFARMSPKKAAVLAEPGFSVPIVEERLFDRGVHGGCAQTVPGRAAMQRPTGAGPGAFPGRGNQQPYPPENCVEKIGPDWDYAASPNLATLPDGHTVIIFAETGSRAGPRSG